MVLLIVRGEFSLELLESIDLQKLIEGVCLVGDLT